jgi:hypothetical protein
MDNVMASIALGLSLVNSLVLVLILREIGSLKLHAGRKTGLRLNSAVPRFAAATLSGSSVTSDSLRSELLLFVSPDCQPCRELLRGLRELPTEVRPPLTITISSRHSFDPRENGRAFVEELGFVMPENVVVDERRRIFNEMNVPVTPFVYALDRNGRVVGSGSPKSAGELRDMAQVLA